MSLREQISGAAATTAALLETLGYHLDFSPTSLWEVDRFLRDNSRKGRPIPGSLLEENLGERMFGLGAYVGETIRQGRGGEWIVDEDDPEGTLNIALELEDGVLIRPVHRVIRRYGEGTKGSVGRWGGELGLEVGDTPAEERRTWWGRRFGSRRDAES